MQILMLEMTQIIIHILFILGWYEVGANLIDHYVHDVKRAIKSKAWLISLYSSLIFSLFSIYYTYTVLTLQYDQVKSWLESETRLSRELITLFSCSMILDLVIGSIVYNDQIDLLSGWMHHLIYIPLCMNLLSSGISNSFLAFALCELPTFLLALGNVIPKFRSSNAVVACVFLPSRIIYCSYVGYFIIAYCSGYIRQSIIPLALMLHIWWFYKLIRKYIMPSRKYFHQSS